MSAKLHMPQRFLVQFCIWLVVGFLSGWMLIIATGPVSAQPQPDLNEFDSDLYLPIDVSHAPPLAAKVDETVELKFVFACGFVDTPGLKGCQYAPILYTAYGEEPFQSTPISVDSNFIVSARLPATDPSHRDSLRYYLEVSEKQTGVSVRYPVEGFLELATAPSITAVDLTLPEKVVPETVLTLPWGSDEDAAGQQVDKTSLVLGPAAIDIGPNGTIAILDEVNRRVLLYDQRTKVLSSFPTLVEGLGDIAIDQARISVLDLTGKQQPVSAINVPQLYQYDLDGNLLEQTPVFALYPALTDGEHIVDWNDVRQMTLVDQEGRGLARDAQRASRSRPDLLARFRDGNTSRIADTKRNSIFELQSSAGLGTIELVEYVRGGYVIVFQAVDAYRIVRFSYKGIVQQDVVVPAEHYSVFNAGAQVATGPDGSVYLMNTTSVGTSIVRIPVPSNN